MHGSARWRYLMLLSEAHANALCRRAECKENPWTSQQTLVLLDGLFMGPAQGVLPARAFRAAQALVVSGGIALLGLVATVIIFYVMASPTFGWTGAPPVLPCLHVTAVREMCLPGPGGHGHHLLRHGLAYLWLDGRAPACCCASISYILLYVDNPAHWEHQLPGPRPSVLLCLNNIFLMLSMGHF